MVNCARTTLMNVDPDHAETVEDVKMELIILAASVLKDLLGDYAILTRMTVDHNLVEIEEGA